MYEGKTKKLNIEWKSLLIKMGILLVVIFIVLWIVSLFNKGNKNVESNLSINLQAMKSAATDYFTGTRLPSSVNGKKKLTLGEMFQQKLVPEFRDQNNKSCDLVDSFIEATKLNNTDYTIKVKLVCGSESDYIINTVSFVDDTKDVVTPKPDDTTNNNDDTNKTDNNSTTTNTNKKPTTSTTTKKPSTSTNKKPVTNVTVNKPNNTTNSCTYGNKEYTSTYPIAYVIPGNCAVSKNDFYKATYANKVSSISAKEYEKINKEISALSSTTGTNLYVESPSYNGIYNKTNNGLVGYQILFTVKQKVNYATYTIYEYYLDQNGNRTAVIDKRNSLVANKPNNNNNSNNSNNVIRVKSVVMNTSAITLDIGESYYATVRVNPTNATNKNVTWTVGNSEIATVTSGGKITGKRAGVTTVTATIDGVSASMRVAVLEKEAYTYCKLNKERVYSTGYIDTYTLARNENRTSSYTLALLTNNLDYYDVKYGTLTYDFAPAYDYLVKKNKPLYSSTGSNGIDPGSATNLKNHSLNSSTITPTVKFNKRYGNYLYFDVTIKYHNVNNIKYTSPYSGVYFVPIYMDVYTYDKNSCIDIFDYEISKYEKNGYVKYQQN